MNAPLLALLFASGVCVALVSARIFSSGILAYGFLVWNLCLAWLPLIFAILVRERYMSGDRRSWRMFGLGSTWLLFFPNAPYIFTDLSHLPPRFYGPFWVDMILILLCALTGLVLGFVSLYLMQSVVAGIWGRAASWLFVGGAAGLSGVGVFIGRFLRLNSWDVLMRPATFYRQVDNWTENPFAHATPYLFPALFAIFMFVVYLMFYGLTQLPQSIQFPERTD